MKATSPRRQLIVVVLLVLAVIGAAVRAFAPNPSLARDIGTLLLVLWLPVIGNVIAFLIARVASMRRRHAFAPDVPFRADLRAELSAAGGQVRVKRDDQRCTIVVGSDGFTARMAAPVADWLTAPQPQLRELELLRPQIALQRLPVGTEFVVFAGSSVVGTGRVTQVTEP